MFRCGICQTVIPAGIKPVRLIRETRPRTYPHRKKAGTRMTVSAKGTRKLEFYDDPGGAGWEIVAETFACPNCG